MPPVLRTALLHLLASSIVILHVLGYLAPELVIGSHFINVIAIPSLVTAGILLPKLVRIPGDAWKQDRFIKWGCSLFVVLALMEVLVYVALMLNVLAKLDSKYLAEDSNPIFRMSEAKFGHLILFSLLGGMLWTPIVVGLRRKDALI